MLRCTMICTIFHSSTETVSAAGPDLPHLAARKGWSVMTEATTGKTKAKAAAPVIPLFDFAQFELPKFGMPNFGLPKFELPRFDLPNAEAPAALREIAEQGIAQ